jgi:hypothetical protein
MRLRPHKGAQVLVSCVAHQGLEAQADGLSIGGGATGCFRLIEEVVVDVEGFLHTDDYAI